MRTCGKLAGLTLMVLVAACGPRQERLGEGNPSLATAQTALASGAPDLALRICVALAESGQRGVDILVCQGNALTAMGRNGEAGAAFEAALDIDRTSTDALIGKGRLRLATDPADAERLFLLSLSRSPRNSVALNNLGIARDLQGRHQDAQTAYSEAIAAAPQSRPPQVNLALSMAMSGRASEASRILRPMAEQPNATPRERHDFAAVLAMDGRPDEAVQYLQPELSGTKLDDAITGFRAVPAGRAP